MQEDETWDTTAGINIWIYAHNNYKAKISQNQAAKTQQLLWFFSGSFHGQTCELYYFPCLAIMLC